MVWGVGASREMWMNAFIGAKIGYCILMCKYSYSINIRIYLHIDRLEQSMRYINYLSVLVEVKYIWCVRAIVCVSVSILYIHMCTRAVYDCILSYKSHPAISLSKRSIRNVSKYYKLFGRTYQTFEHFLNFWLHFIDMAWSYAPRMYSTFCRITK